MIAIFFWSAIAGGVTAVAAIAKVETARATRDAQQGLARAAAQAEIQDFIRRSQQG